MGSNIFPIVVSILLCRTSAHQPRLTEISDAQDASEADSAQKLDKAVRMHFVFIM